MPRQKGIQRGRKQPYLNNQQDNDQGGDGVDGQSGQGAAEESVAGLNPEAGSYLRLHSDSNQIAAGTLQHNARQRSHGRPLQNRAIPN
jgi:hypothetical protein